MSVGIEKRYIRNIPAISAAEQISLKSKKAVVIGCGGIGGFAIEYLARLGVGSITVVDDDRFDSTNLNRQLLSSDRKVGFRKVMVAKEHVLEINPDVSVKSLEAFLGANNAQDIIKGHDIIIDALDNVQARLVLEDAAAKEGIPIVHGGVQGWNMQITVSLPGSNTIHSLYKNVEEDSADVDKKTCLIITPACCASIQVAEALKILLGRKSDLEGKVLMFNLNDMSSVEFSLSNIIC